MPFFCNVILLNQFNLPKVNLEFTSKLAKSNYYYASFLIPYFNFLTFIGDGLALYFLMCSHILCHNYLWFFLLEWYCLCLWLKWSHLCICGLDKIPLMCSQPGGSKCWIWLVGSYWVHWICLGVNCSICGVNIESCFVGFHQENVKSSSIPTIGK